MRKHAALPAALPVPAQVPDLVATPQYAALSAGWFWDKNHLNTYADKNDMQGLTKKINGGTHGIEDRIARTQLALDTLMA
jgi:putative chitinase